MPRKLYRFFQRLKGSEWCSITSTPIHPLLFTRPFHLTKKLEFNYTPENSSRLNMAEVEISGLTEQCLDRRLASQAMVASEVGAWEVERNAVRANNDWCFTIPNARDKLKKLYPVGQE